MIRAYVNRLVSAAMDELFLNSSSHNLKVSLMGSDLFSESSLHWKNLVMRPDIFDIALQPIQLVSGHIGKITIEGITEIAFGGKLTFQAENIFLLFRVDEEIDAERAQILKKLLIEMKCGSLPQTFIKELLKKIQGFPNGKNVEFLRKRRLLVKGINYWLSNSSFTIKNIHIRIEVPHGNSDKISSIGVTFPYFRMLPGNIESKEKESPSKSYPSMNVTIKSFQVYCDYECSSYCKLRFSDPQFHLSVLHEFKTRWPVEVHTAMVLPIDLDFRISLEIDARSGMMIPKVHFGISQIRFAVDPRQIEVLVQFLELFTIQSKRIGHLVKVRGIFGRRWLPPRVGEVRGIYLLPHLTVNNAAYPQSAVIPHNRKTSIVQLLKARLGPAWAKGVWRHVIRCVIEDLRLSKPFGRWIELIKLTWIRKQYAFIFSRFLRRSKDTGNYIMNINANVDPAVYIRIFDMEMNLSVESIRLFRNLAIMIAFVETMNSKRFQSRQSAKGAPYLPSPFDRVNIQWKDLVFLHTLYTQEKTRSLFDRNSQVAEDEDEGGIDEDSLSPRDDSSSSASSASFSTPVRPVAESSSLSMGSPNLLSPSPIKSPVSSSTNSNMNSNSNSSAPSKSSFRSAVSSITGLAGRHLSSNSSNNSNATSNNIASTPNKTVSSAMKMFSNITSTIGLSGASSSSTDDVDSKLLGKSDMAAFSEFFGRIEKDDTASETSVTTNTILTMKDIVYTICDWGLVGDNISRDVMSESMRWTLLRHQNPLSFLPPDLFLKLNTFEFNIRYPLRNNERKTFASILAKDIGLTLQIVMPAKNAPTLQPAPMVTTPVKPSSKSFFSPFSSLQHTSNASKDTVENITDIRSLESIQTLVTLLGSYIQLKISVGSVQCSLWVNPSPLSDALKYPIPLPKIKSKASSLPLPIPAPSLSLAVNGDDISVLTMSSGAPSVIHGHNDGDARGDEDDEELEDGEDDEYDQIQNGIMGTNKPNTKATDRSRYDNERDVEKNNDEDYDESGDEDDDDDDDAKRRRAALSSLMNAYSPNHSSQPEEHVEEINTSDQDGKEQESIVVVDYENRNPEIIEILSSDTTSNFFVLYLTMEYDVKGKGSADLSITFSDCNFDISGIMAAGLIDHIAYTNLESLLNSKNKLNYFVDKLSVTSNGLDMPCLAATTNKVSSKRSGNELSKKNVDKTENIQESLVYWSSFVDFFMPKTLSLTLHSSKIKMNFFTAAMIKDIVASVTKDISERTNLSSHAVEKLTPLVDYFTAINGWIGHSVTYFQGYHTRASIAIPSTDFSLKKFQCQDENPRHLLSNSSLPSASILELRVFGIEFALPMDDETVAQTLSLLLSYFMPVNRD